MLKRFWRAKDGLAAVEFGMLAPVMAAMFLGSIEVCSALDCQQKVAGMASTAADLVAQETTVSDSDLSNVYAAVNSIVYPFSGSTVKIVNASVSAVNWRPVGNPSSRIARAPWRSESADLPARASARSKRRNIAPNSSVSVSAVE